MALAVVLLASTAGQLASATPAAAATGAPDLTVTMTASPEPVTTGATLTYTLQVSNSSVERCTPTWPEPTCIIFGRAVTGVAVSLSLPAGTKYQSGDGDHNFVCPSSASGATVTCAGGSLAMDDTARVTLRLTTPGTTGAITALATVDPSNTISERSETNNTATRMSTVVAAGPRAYVGHTYSNSALISVIETQSNTVVNTLPLNALCGMSVMPGGSRLYVNQCTNALTVIDAASNAVTGSIPLGFVVAGNPALSPDGTRMYVGGSTANGVVVSIIETSTSAVLGTMTVTPTLAGIGQIVVSPDGSRLYVSWSGRDGHIAVVDTASRSVTADIPAGTDSSGIRMLIHPSGRTLYYVNGHGGFVLDTATNTTTAATAFWTGQMVMRPDGARFYDATGNNEIRVIDAATSALVTVVQLPAWDAKAYAIGISPDGSRVYVTDAITEVVWQIDTATNAVLKPLPVAYRPGFVALPPAAPRLREYVVSSGTNSVSVIDRATNERIASVPVGTQPTGVGLAPDGRRAYVANSGSNNVSIVDTSTNVVAASIPVGQHPTGVGLSPDGKRVYVTNFWSDTVSVIDTALSSVVATVGTGTDPNRVAVSPDGKRAYVTNFGGGSVSVIDTLANANIGTIQVGGQPSGLSFTPDGSRLYAASSYGSTGGVSVIDPTTNTVLALIPVPFASGVAVSPDGQHVYVTEPNISRVAVIGVKTNSVEATLPIGWSPTAVALSADGARAFITDWGGGGEGTTVHVLDTATNLEVGTQSVGTTPLDIATGFVPTISSSSSIATAQR